MIMILGQRFKATDKQGHTALYRYEGIEPQPNGYDIRLHNIDNDTDTFVEDAWFGQRKIVNVE